LDEILDNSCEETLSYQTPQNQYNFNEFLQNEIEALKNETEKLKFIIEQSENKIKEQDDEIQNLKDKIETLIKRTRVKDIQIVNLEVAQDKNHKKIKSLEEAQENNQISLEK